MTCRLLFFPSYSSRKRKKCARKLPSRWTHPIFGSSCEPCTYLHTSALKISPLPLNRFQHELDFPMLPLLILPYLTAIIKPQKREVNKWCASTRRRRTIAYSHLALRTPGVRDNAVHSRPQCRFEADQAVFDHHASVTSPHERINHFVSGSACGYLEGSAI